MQADSNIRVPESSVDLPIISKLTADERLLLDIVNQERNKNRLPAFSNDFRLVELARLKSEEMFISNYFNHISPTHGTALDMKKRYGISARVMGAENIAKAATIRRVHELLMDSEEHRDNILSNLHDTIGIGVHRSRYGVIVTQLFIGH